MDVIRLKNEFTKGIIRENPIFIMLLGLCPVLAVSTSVVNGIGMGLATTAVLLLSNIIISVFRKIIPSNIRIPVFIVVIASFVTVTELLMKAYAPALNEALGIFIPLIVCNCAILGRVEAFASKNKLSFSISDGLGMGLGFTLGLAVLATVREVLGAGEFLGYSLYNFDPALIMILPPGSFIAMGVLLGLLIKAQSVRASKERG